MSQESPDRQGQAGFTLIELLVALTLVSLMSVAMFGGLRFGARTWEVGTSRSEEINEVILVQELLRRHLVQLATLDQVRQRSEEHPIFEGDSQSVHFLAPLSAHVGVNGLYQFELSLEDGEEGSQRLMIRWQLYRADRLPGCDQRSGRRAGPARRAGGGHLHLFRRQRAPGRAGLGRDLARAGPAALPDRP